MSLITSPNDILCLTPIDGHMMGGIGLETFSSQIPFQKCEPLDRNEINYHSLPPFTPSYDKCDVYSTTFEDPFSYRPDDDFPTLVEDNKSRWANETNLSSVSLSSSSSSSSSDETENKLLSFRGPILKAPMYNDTGQTWPIMSAELYGMFFVAEDVFGENNPRRNELTCYRRNLFQINGVIILSRGIKGIIDEHGQQIPIYSLEASLTAFESIDGKSTEIISVPWKSANSTSGDEKTGSAPLPHILDLSLKPELDPSAISIPISWKRLQFKHATANNGRRKGLQQHYVIQVNLVATLASGELVKLAEIQSASIIVRGRSPRNFDSRTKEVEKRTDGKLAQNSESNISYPQNMDHITGQCDNLQEQQSECLHSPSDIDQENNHISNSDESRPAKRQPISPPGTYSSPTKPSWKPGILSKMNVVSTPAALESSLVTEENQMCIKSTSHKSRIPSTESNSPFAGRGDRSLSIGHLIENADFLYEYFPLSLDDWMAPVDAVYRPHVVHHTIIPEDVRAEQKLNKRKTYFSAYD